MENYIIENVLLGKNDIYFDCCVLSKMSSSLEDFGLTNIDIVAKVLDAVLPKEIGYVLLKCGTLVMIKPESIAEVHGEKNSIFTDIGEDSWDYPYHRFNNQDDLSQIVTENQKYLCEFLENRSVNEKIYFQIALKYMRQCGYPYPGGERSDRFVDTPIPIEVFIQNLEIDKEEFVEYREFLMCEWQSTPGLFNHCITSKVNPKMNLPMANHLLADLHRHDFICPRFHSMRKAC